MIKDFININFKQLSVHQVGNKTKGEPLIVSKAPLDIEDDNLRLYLLKQFTAPFTSTELFTLTSANDDPKVNPMFQFVSSAFTSPRSFHSTSVNIAKHLYDVSVHPNIKDGDLFVTLFENIEINGIQTNAVGIYKCESKADFVKINYTRNHDSSISHQIGLNLEKLDKACLIYDLERGDGYRVSIVDKSNKSQEAFYWSDLFLKVKSLSNDFSNTRVALEMAKSFVTEKLSDEYDLSRADQIGLLNKSSKYFKEKDEFNAKEFESEVFEDPSLIKSFRKFSKEYQEQYDTSLESGFEIEQSAVKKYARVLKSVLKLDKNFHVYIHGDRDLIEQGQEKDGRKYYKIYFVNES